MKKANSTNAINEQIIKATCGTAVTLFMIGGRWKLTILWQLLNGKMRYSDLRRKIPAISERMLVMQLRDLEKNELIKRAVYPEVPPRVEYELTKLGVSMKPMLQQIEDWGLAYRKKVMKR
jgi:DNA-binding HxlR family transcriptional regulator